MLNRLTDSLDFQGQALQLRSERQRLIASNIANADTPGYVARDMDFARRCGRHGTCRQERDRDLAPGTSVPAAGPAAAGRERDPYATPSQTNLDRNTVDMDRERASFADNAIKYEATLRFINSSVRTSLSAITGQ